MGVWSGQDFGWRYLAYRVDGSGPPTQLLDGELPLHDVAISDVLSGPPQLTGTIDPVLRRLLGPDGQPILREWGTAIFAEQGGLIRGGGLLVRSGYSGPEWSLDCSGLTSYAKGMGWLGDERRYAEADPLDIIRDIWDHVQAGPRSNLGLQVDRATRTPVRVGARPVVTADGSTAPQSTPVSTSSQDTEEYVLARQLTDDLGGEVDTLCGDAGIEYHERHQWNAERTAVESYLDFGYPRIGQRRNLRFVLGENVQTVPSAERDGGDYASHVRVVGAGEGLAMVMAEAMVDDGRLRRMVTVDDKSITDIARAQVAARDELARRLMLTGVSQVAVRNTPDTPLGSWTVGDEIRLRADTDWLKLDYWFRVLAITVSPDSPEVVTMSLMRADGGEL